MDSAADNEVLRIHREYRERLGQIASGLALPHQLPGPMEALKLPHQPLGQVRKVIAKAFAPDGWRIIAGQPAGTHRLSKASPMGRPMLLDFDTGSWPRAGVGLLKLIAEPAAGAAAGPFLHAARRFSLPLVLENSVRYQYSAPNPEVFHQILENMIVVARHLEHTWVVEMEHGLGPPPAGYQYPSS